MIHVKANYSDGSIWKGPVSDWDNSPATDANFGILNIFLFLDAPRKIQLNSHDDYYLKLKGRTVYAGAWAPYQPPGKQAYLYTIDNNTFEVSFQWLDVSQIPRGLSKRLGKYVSDDFFYDRYAEAMQWKHEDEGWQ